MIYCDVISRLVTHFSNTDTSFLLYRVINTRAVRKRKLKVRNTTIPT